MKTKRLIASISIAVIVLGLVNFYIGFHIWLFLQALLPEFPSGIFWTVFLLIAFAYVIGYISWPQPLRPIARLFKVIGSYYLAFMEFAVIMLPVTDLLYGLLGVLGLDRNDYVTEAGGVLLVLLILFMVWGSRNAWSTVVRNHTLQIDKSIGNSSPLTIAVASDLHLGNIVGNRHLKRMVMRINEMNPDVILLAGDVLDDSIEPFIRNRMSETLRQLKARYGIYAVLGNHEYYGGSIEQYTELMKSIGIRVLQDEVVEVAGTYIAGRKDKSAETMEATGRVSVPVLLEGIDHSRPVIMMDHQPTGFDIAAKAGVDILLSGHTHRGQIAPNHWITRRLFELDWGYLLKEKLHIVVSSGFGTWGPPIRLASRSEIIKLEVMLEGSKRYRDEAFTTGLTKIAITDIL
ncbi:metallophosphoesterase [Paenibacillus sp. BR2-3]|uniref:metallophosphoesterase n=1 Tax=Paenibacillus sp. BR2-3 TaxID=3048494 RepID=UPI0039776A07